MQRYLSGIDGRIPPKCGYLLVMALALLPCIYLLFLERSLFTVDFNYMTRLSGRLSALFGMSLMSLTFLLNTRLAFIENLFGGLDKAYKAHHIFGTAAFISLLVHPLFLASTYLGVSVVAAARFLLPGNLFANDLGIFGLFSMELFLTFTFFIKTMVKYQNWKFVHRLLGASFVLGSLHVLLISSDVRSNIILRGYMVLMILVGLASYIYRTLLWRRLVKRYDYVLGAVKPLDSSITELSLSPKNEAVSFIPGQFIFISFQTEGLKRLENPHAHGSDFHGFDSAVASNEPHPFTISSSSSDRTIRLSVKNLGDFTSGLKNINAGTNLKIEGPYGRFCPLFYGGKDQVWIAGGIGVTPFLSMARSMEKEPLRTVDMYYCVRDMNEATFLGELKGISGRNKNLKVIPFFSSEKGRINAEHISAASGNLKSKEIFICGPAAMMRALRSQLRKMGVPGSSIHLEEFEL